MDSFKFSRLFICYCVNGKDDAFACLILDLVLFIRSPTHSLASIEVPAQSVQFIRSIASLLLQSK